MKFKNDLSDHSTAASLQRRCRNWPDIVQTDFLHFIVFVQIQICESLTDGDF